MMDPAQHTLTNRRILLCVGGGIAAYKAADLCRQLQQAGADVRVAMTAAASEFITPLTLQALSGHGVHTTLFDPEAEAAMGHIELARWADLLLVAPATADLLARLVQGQGDDIVLAACLATRSPVAVAPAMNSAMWEDPATQDNLATLRNRGMLVWGPDDGWQACGEVGTGRMLDPAELVARCADQFVSGALQGVPVMVTAGPTLEDIDPVRFLGNRSSGRMGYAIAEAARDAGAQVTLISGPVRLAPPDRVRLVQVRSARQMFAAVQEGIDLARVFIGVAAVADYRPASPAQHKIKKSDAPMTIDLVPNPDILAWVAAQAQRPYTVGFAAESERLDQYARDKLRRKGVDMIAANQVGQPGQGFDAENNALQVFWTRDGGNTIQERYLGEGSKQQLARQLVAIIAEQRRATG